MSDRQSFIGRGFSALVGWLNSAGTALIFALMLLINADVFSRFLFNAPIDGVTEMVELSIVAIVFLQLGDAIRAGRLTRSDGLFMKIQAARPKLAHYMSIVFDMLGALFFAGILYGAWPRLIDAWERGYFAGNRGIFVVPVWPIRLILVIGCVVAIFVFLGFVRRHVSELAGHGRDSE